MKFGKMLLALATALSLTVGAWAQEKTEKKAKKAAEAVEKKATDAAGEKKTAVKKKAAEAVEEKKAATEKKAAPAEKKVEAAEKKVAEKKAVAKKGGAYTGGVVNINTATKTQLMELPGVGEANADHIIKGRPYKSADELITKKVVQQRYYDEFKQFITTK